MTTPFKDHFSKQSNFYLKYRPTYPPELFTYLSTLTKSHDLAWDCGTGNGQSALNLAGYYKAVYATDPSEQQIQNARVLERIVYKVEKAEHCGLNDASVDLITIAQALHWFDFDAFYAEAKRVLKNNGVIAAWTYGLPSIAPEIDAVIHHLHNGIVDEFWQHENRLIEKEYATIPFPFEELSSPAFTMHKDLSLNDLLGLLNSWSAVQRYKDKYGNNPVDITEQELTGLWGKRDEKKMTHWKLILKLGRNPGH